MLEPTPAASANFSAVLLAGGRSSRMGEDKAGVILAGQPLWQHQLATLRSTSPGVLFISGKIDGLYAGAGIEILPDAEPDLGPLAGISATLHRAPGDLLLVLAIDLPAMTAEFLRGLVRAALATRTGIVCQNDGRLEPLAAVYPRTALPLLDECMHSADRSMHHFVHLAAGQALVNLRELQPAELPLFRNLNTPADC